MCLHRGWQGTYILPEKQVDGQRGKMEYRLGMPSDLDNICSLIGDAIT